MCCCRLCILWRGLLRAGVRGMEISEEWGFCPRKCRWDTGSGRRAECGQRVPSTMKVLDLEELNGSPGDKREIERERSRPLPAERSERLARMGAATCCHATNPPPPRPEGGPGTRLGMAEA